MALLSLPMSVRAAEFEAEGFAEVVDGNIASARSRALEQGRRKAFLSAVQSIVGTTPGRPSLPDARRWAEARESSYVRNYRVLEEERTDTFFRLRVAVSVDIGRLRDDLGTSFGQVNHLQDDAATERSPAAKLALWTTSGGGRQGQVGPTPSSALEREALELLQVKLREAGLRPLVVSAADRDLATAAAARQGCKALIAVGLQVDPLPGVRGLGLKGARARVELRVVVLLGGEAVGGTGQTSWLAEAVATGASAEQAASQAVSRAVSQASRQLPPTLFEARTGGKTASRRGYQLLLRGLSSLAQQRELCQRMRSHSARVGKCTPWRFQDGGVVVRLERAPAPAALARTIRIAASNMGLEARVAPMGPDASSVSLTALPLPTTDLE